MHNTMANHTTQPVSLPHRYSNPRYRTRGTRLLNNAPIFKANILYATYSCSEKYRSPLKVLLSVLKINKFILGQIFVVTVDNNRYRNGSCYLKFHHDCTKLFLARIRKLRLLHVYFINNFFFLGSFSISSDKELVHIGDNCLTVTRCTFIMSHACVI